MIMPEQQRQHPQQQEQQQQQQQEQEAKLTNASLSSSQNGGGSVDTTSTSGEVSSEDGKPRRVDGVQETASSKHDSSSVQGSGSRRRNPWLSCVGKICCCPVWVVLCVNAMVFTPIYTMPLGMAVYSLSVYFAKYWILRGILLSYLLYVVLDRKTPNRGGWDRDLPFLCPCFRFYGRHFFRSNPLFKLVAYYFGGMKLVKTSDLDPQESHLFLYHPHGVIAMGANTAFFTNGSYFDKVFPGMDRSGVTLNATFLAPLFREFILSIGLMSANRATLVRQLSKPGKSVCLVPGGAAEALHTQPGTCRVYLSRRRGFIKVALETGCTVVPCIGFGENDIFSTFYGGEEYRQLQRIVEHKKLSKRMREEARASAIASASEAEMPMPASAPASRRTSYHSGLADPDDYPSLDNPVSSRSIVNEVMNAVDDLVTADNAVEDVDELDHEYIREDSRRSMDLRSNSRRSMSIRDNSRRSFTIRDNSRHSMDEELAMSTTKVEVAGLEGIGQTTTVPREEDQDEEPRRLQPHTTEPATAEAAAADAVNKDEEELLLDPPRRLSWYGRFKAWVFGLQLRVMRILSFSLPIIVQPIPYPAKVTVVTGAPMRFPKTSTPIAPELVEEYHQWYVQTLVDLYNDHKHLYAQEGVEIEVL